MKRTLVIGALVAAGLVVACDDDSMGPGTTGSITLQVTLGTQPAASGEAAGTASYSRVTTPSARRSKILGEESSPVMRLGPARGTGGTAAVDARKVRVSTTPREQSEGQAGRTQPEQQGAAAVESVPPAAPAAPSAIDNATLRVIGPTNRTLENLAPGSTHTVENLTVGTYVVVLEGYAGGLVDHFSINSGVQVRSRQNTTVNVTFNSFRPAIAAIASPTTAVPFRFSWPPVPNANEYVVQLDSDPGFSNPLEAQISETAAVATVVQPGTYYVRARAINNTYVGSGGRWGDSRSVQVIEDTQSGPDAANAAYMGFMGGQGPIELSDLNILPENDQDWFSVTVCEQDVLQVETFALRMEEPSELDTYLRLWDPSGSSLIAENDDIDLEGGNWDSYIEATIPADGDYRIEVWGTEYGPIGSYKLTIDVVLGPNNNGTQCTTAGPPVEVAVTPSGVTIQGSGSTQQFTADAFDDQGRPIPGQTFTWTSLNPTVATVNASGLVTAVANGQVAVAAEADGVKGYALVTVTQAPAVDVNLWGDDQYTGTATLYGTWFAGPSDGWAVGGSGALVHYDGNAWTAVAAPGGLTNTIWDVWGTASANIWAVGTGGLIMSYDGSNWRQELNSPTTGTLWRVWAASPNDVFAAGADGAGNGAIFHFDGANWTSMSVPAVVSGYYGVWGSSASNVYAVGEAGEIIHYDGASWTTMTNVGTNLWGVWGTSSGDVWAVGDGGTAFHFNGSSWTAQPAPTTNWLWSVWGTSPNDVYAVGTSGTIMRWDGSTWTGMVSTVTFQIRDIWGNSSSPLTAVGGGVILPGYRGGTIVPTQVAGFSDNIPNVKMSIASNGSSYYTASGGAVSTGYINRYDMSGTFIGQVPAGIDIRALLYSPQTGGFYIKDFPGDWYQVDPNTGTSTLLLSGIFPTSSQTSPALHPNGRFIYEHNAGTVRVLDSSTGTELETFGVQYGYSNSVATNGNYLFTAGTATDRLIYVHDFKGNLLTTFTVPSGNHPWSLSWANGLLWLSDSTSPTANWYGYRLTVVP